MEEENRRLTRKEKRLLRQQTTKENVSQRDKINFNLKNIQPLTENQHKAFDAFNNGKNLMLHGIAGTGKSFIAMYLGLTQILAENPQYRKIVIVRSAVAVRDMGFMPGSQSEKMKVYEAPYYNIFGELFGRGDAYEYMKQKKIVEFVTTSFIRGITLNDSIVIVDEIANMTGHELDSVITRIGKNCKVLFCGDLRQSDFIRDNDKSGLSQFMSVIKRMKQFEFVDFQKEDIVRSSMVKAYIIEKDRLDIAF